MQLHLTDKVKGGKLHVEQGVIAGCAGGLYDNIAEAAAILDGCDVGSGNFDFSVYPPSVPVELELVENPPTMPCPSVTPPGISPTARAPSPATASCPA